MKKNKTHFAALLLALTLLFSCATPAMALEEIPDNDNSAAVVHRADLKELSSDIEIPGSGEDTEPVTQIEAVAFLLRYAGMADTQLGTYPDDYEAMANSMGMLPDDYMSDEPCTQALFEDMKNSPEWTALQEAMSADKKSPLFLNGMAQPIFPYTTGATAEYSNEDSDIIRYCVYVETNHDTDGDGKLDLVKAFVQLPRAVAEGDYQAATIYEARPYITGCTDQSLPYVDAPVEFDMYAAPDPRESTGTSTTMEAAAAAKSADWYYYNPYEDYNGYMCYEDLNWYDYYLVRGFAVVEVGGLGTRGSEGFETCGSDLEIDAFKCVIEWLTGDRKAYTDKENNIEIEADWSNGKVGMTGRSYSGTTQFGLATTGVKGLETVVPVAGIASWYEYTNSQEISTQEDPAYTNTLAAYCTGRYLDSEAAVAEAHQRGHSDYTSNGDYETIQDSYGRYLNQMKEEQKALNGDYGDHWKIRDYTIDAQNIQCPALIVHGLNDYNVRTKEFDLMYQAFQSAGQNVKLLLHQDGHLTPSYVSSNLAFNIGDQPYEDILNQWFSHYLYDLENGAEDMAAVTAEDSHSSAWHTYDSWETAANLVLNGTFDQGPTTTITSNDAAAGINRSNWKDVFSSGSTAGNALYAATAESDTVIKGSTAVHFRAAVNNADNNSPAGTDLNRDALMVSAMLVDIAPEGETFPVFQTQGPYVPKITLKEGGAWIGGGVPNLDLKEHVTTDVSYNIVSRGWMDLCNPNAGYDSASAAQTDRVSLKAGEYNDYTIYLQPTIYEVEAGHTLALVIYADEPDMAYYTQDYTITLEHASVWANIPIDADESPAALCAFYQSTEPEQPEVTEYALDVSASEGGTVSSTVANGTVQEGTQVSVTASADSDYKFTGWTINGADAGSDNPLTVTVNCDTTIAANFVKSDNGGHSDNTDDHSNSGSSTSSVTYPVYVERAENGKLTASARHAEKGDHVRLTVSADPGYVLDSLTVTSKNGTSIKTSMSGDHYTFTMPASAVTVSATFVPAHTFSDVADTAYYKNAVQWAVEQGIANGVSSSMFAPDLACTRAQAVTFLWRSLGCPAPASTANPFVDVAEDAYYRDAVLWAVENHVTNGTSATMFNPDQTVTRGQFMTFLWRSVNGSTMAYENLFTDVSPDMYYCSAVLWAVCNNITNGTTATTFSPDAPCTRAQIVTFLWRSVQ